MSKPQLAISLGQYSTAGAKPENQDFHGAMVPEGADLASKGVACAIADGISTSRRGGEAAAISVNSFLTDYFCTSEAWSVRKSGDCVISATNSWMHSENARQRPREEGTDREAAGLICTLTAVVLKSRMAHIFHVGDGQVLRLSGDSAEVLTTEHRVHLGGGSSYLGRALGVNRYVDVEYCQIPIQPGDVFLLTTDGVHEVVSAADLRAVLAAHDDLDAAARALADLAAQRDSTDNLTVQILRVDALPLGEVQDLLVGEMRLPPAPQLKEGMVFEGYEILEQIHASARSHAYLARDVEDENRVVVKVPSTEQAQNPEAISALLLEEWVMRRLDHPNLLGAAPSRGARRYAYCVSRYVGGRTLHDYMQETGPLALAPARKIAAQISTGLEAMHRREMLHRDVRPQNIILYDRGENDPAHVTIIDFGSTQVAGIDEAAPRDFEDAAFAGTMQYSAPELYLGHPASPESDVFSLGVIMYQMLTGELPYGTRVAAADTPAKQKRLKYTPASSHDPDIPAWVDAALERAVAVDPRQRYSEPAILIGDLARPNEDLLRGSNLPLAGRGPLRTWRIIAAVLAAALIISIVTRPDFDLGPSRSISAGEMSGEAGGDK